MQRAVSGKTGQTCFPGVTRSLVPVPQLKKPLDVGDDDRRTMLAEIGLNPPLLGFAGRYKRPATTKTKSLYRPDKPLLPTMIM